MTGWGILQPMINAYAAAEPGARLEPFQYDPGALRSDEVEIQVESCGICHSDLSMLQNDWGITTYPFVPGHEVIGLVADIGEDVGHLSVGQRVGLGWHSGYCMSCVSCLSGDHNLCATADQTIVGRHGGFADRVRARSTSVIPLPQGLDPVKAGPFFCGGITVFNPLLQFDLKPTARVGVIGIGGLGHLAIQFLEAWGCHVTAFTSSETKRKEALSLGAKDTINSRDADAIDAAASAFDLLLSTVNVKLDWNRYLATLRPKGRLHFLGVTLEPLDIQVTAMLAGQLSVSSSPVGSPRAIAHMLDFAARHEIEPTVETYKMKDVNEALERLHSGQARYRIVLTH